MAQTKSTTKSTIQHKKLDPLKTFEYEKLLNTKKVSNITNTEKKGK